MRVLVVDDEPDVRLVARVILEAAGHHVDEAGSGEAALDHLDRSTVPDVVLLDVRMPGLDGWEVLRRIRRNPGVPTIPVVIFTADIDAAAEAPLHLREHEFFLAKPFDPDELVQLLVQAVRRS